MTVYATMRHQGTECFRYKRMILSQLCVSTSLRLLITGVVMHSGDAHVRVDGGRGWRSYSLLLLKQKMEQDYMVGDVITSELGIQLHALIPSYCTGYLRNTYIS